MNYPVNRNPQRRGDLLANGRWMHRVRNLISGYYSEAALSEMGKSTLEKVKEWEDKVTAFIAEKEAEKFRNNME